jgi:propanol-preferring alcohol dehydrogenase
VVLGVRAHVGEIPFADENPVVGTVIGSRPNMDDVLALAGAGKIGARCESHGLDEAVDVVGRLRRGEVKARAALVPGR